MQIFPEIVFNTTLDLTPQSAEFVRVFTTLSIPIDTKKLWAGRDFAEDRRIDAIGWIVKLFYLLLDFLVIQIFEFGRSLTAMANL